MSVPKRALLRESWLSWLLLAMSIGLLSWDVAIASSPGGSRWYWLLVVWFAVLIAWDVRLLRRQYAWVAGRAEREANYRAVRENFLRALYRFGVPDDAAMLIDRAIEQEKYAQALRMMKRHMPHPDRETNPE